MAEHGAAEVTPPPRRRIFLLTIISLLAITVTLGLLVADLGPEEVTAPEEVRTVQVTVDTTIRTNAPLTVETVNAAKQTVVVAHQGSGFLLQKNLVISAAHVVGNPQEMIVPVFCDGEDKPGIVLANEPLYDIAIISAECDATTLKLRTNKLGTDEPLRIAVFNFDIEEVDGNVIGTISRFVLGASPIPDGHLIIQASPDTAQIIALQNEMRKQRIPRHRALTPMVRPGNSGSPVFDLKGNVVGMVVIRQMSHGRSFMVPAENIRKVLKAAGIAEGDQ